MKPISIFSNSKLSWLDTVIRLNEIIKIKGSTAHYDEENQCAWSLLGLEITAIQKPNLLDDCGINFSRYEIQVEIVLTNQFPEESFFLSELGHATAKTLAACLSKHSRTETIIVENLQNETFRFECPSK